MRTTYDFVGPSQFQWTEKQMKVMNDILDVLPPRLRSDLSNPGRLKPPVQRSPVDYMTRLDPLEAIRSREIIP